MWENYEFYLKNFSMDIPNPNDTRGHDQFIFTGIP